MLCECSLCIDMSMDLFVFVNYLLNEFAICYAVVAVFVLNEIVLLFAGETMYYCLPEYMCMIPM